MTIQDKIAEKKELLAEVNTAIKKALSGQSYTLGSRSVTRADLDDLRSFRRELEAEIAALEERGTTKRRFKRIVPFG